jgi:hypothetical protein
MIPRFFRCGDPAKKCPLALTREILTDLPNFVCPCNNEGCSLLREDVGLVDGLTNGRSKLVYAGVAVLIFVLLLALIMSGGDPATIALAELRARLVPLETELHQLETRSKSPRSLESSTTDAKELQTAASSLEMEATNAIGSKEPTQVAEIQKKISIKMGTVSSFIDSLDQPKEGSAVIAADAKSLVTKLIRLEDDAELRIEAVITKSPHSAELCEAFLTEVADCQTLARRLTSLATPVKPSPESKLIRQSLGQLLARLEATQAKLGRFVPPPHLPFRPEEADLVIAASGSLAKDLVAPLTAAWSGGLVVLAEDGNIYITGKNGRRILVKDRTSVG